MRRPQREILDIDPERIILFCSMGTHFDEAVHELKRRFPRARLTAVAPGSVAQPLSERGLIDDLVDMSRNKLRVLTDFRECARLLRAIRTERSDLVVTMYDSTALNLLQSLSRGRAHAVFDTRRVLYPINVGRFYLLRMVLGNIFRVLFGTLAYALIRVTLWASAPFQKRRRP